VGTPQPSRRSGGTERIRDAARLGAACEGIPPARRWLAGLVFLLEKVPPPPWRAPRPGPQPADTLAGHRELQTWQAATVRPEFSGSRPWRCFQQRRPLGLPLRGRPPGSPVRSGPCSTRRWLWGPPRWCSDSIAGDRTRACRVQQRSHTGGLTKRALNGWGIARTGRPLSVSWRWRRERWSSAMVTPRCPWATVARAVLLFLRSQTRKPTGSSRTGHQRRRRTTTTYMPNGWPRTVEMSVPAPCRSRRESWSLGSGRRLLMRSKLR